MKKNLFWQYRDLDNYLKSVYQVFPPDLIDDLEREDPTSVQNIRRAEAEHSKLGVILFGKKRKYKKVNKEEHPDLFPPSAFYPQRPKKIASFTGSSATLPPQTKENKTVMPPQTEKTKPADISAAMPERPKQKRKQQLLGTTAFTFSSDTVVNTNFTKNYTGINWPHFENMLMLFALDFFEPSEKMKLDREELEKAIEIAGNAKYKRKNRTLQQILNDRLASGSYMKFGKRVINAMAKPNRFSSEFALTDLEVEIAASPNKINRDQLNKVMGKAQDIFRTLNSRYRGR